jgi:hypothetical protein
MNLSRKFLAGALIALLPLGSALACTTSAWLGTPGANPTLAEDPDTNSATNNSPDNGAVRRYSGQCGLQAAAAGQSWVGDNSPGGAGGGESIYRARFYVYTGQTGAQVFSATTADNGGGTEVIGITFNGSAFVFNVNGATVPSVTGVLPNAWYAVEFLYQANGAFSATVRGGGASAQTVVNSSVNAGALTVGSARLGQINAGSGTGNVLVDEFDSSRSAGTPIGRLCPADATGNRVLTVGDIAAITAERNGTLAAGQPDCTENGTLTVGDIACVISFRSATPPNSDCVFL